MATYLAMAANEAHFCDCCRIILGFSLRCRLVETAKRFLNVHLHCIVSSLTKISKMVTLPPTWKSFYRRPWCPCVPVLLISSFYRSVLTVTGRPIASSNKYDPMVPLRPNTHQTITLSTLCLTILMLMRFSTNPKAHILFVTVATKEQVCFPTEQGSRMVFDSLTDDLPTDTHFDVVSASYLPVADRCQTLFVGSS